ncbi:MAG TPA: hypothetical protein PLD27_03840 [bacterium]|nr:hypothetical protein [bacterium]HOL47997.1 hypothetical protein [bacterium]HPQ18595.1 hypothetical protein [bacterium]
MNEDLLKGSHPIVIEAVRNKNKVAIGIVNTKKLKSRESEFVYSFLRKNPEYIFYDVERKEFENKYIFIKPYTDEEIIIID